MNIFIGDHICISINDAVVGCGQYSSCFRWMIKFILKCAMRSNVHIHARCFINRSKFELFIHEMNVTTCNWRTSYWRCALKYSFGFVIVFVFYFYRPRPRQRLLVFFLIAKLIVHATNIGLCVLVGISFGNERKTIEFLKARALTQQIAYRLPLFFSYIFWHSKNHIRSRAIR